MSDFREIITKSHNMISRIMKIKQIGIRLHNFDAYIDDHQFQPKVLSQGQYSIFSLVPQGDQLSLGDHPQFVQQIRDQVALWMQTSGPEVSMYQRSYLPIVEEKPTRFTIKTMFIWLRYSPLIEIDQVQSAFWPSVNIWEPMIPAFWNYRYEPISVRQELVLEILMANPQILVQLLQQPFPSDCRASQALLAAAQGGIQTVPAGEGVIWEYAVTKRMASMRTFIDNIIYLTIMQSSQKPVKHAKTNKDKDVLFIFFIYHFHALYAYQDCNICLGTATFDGNTLFNLNDMISDILVKVVLSQS